MKTGLNIRLSRFIVLLTTIVVLIINLFSSSVWCQKSYRVAILPEYLPIVIFEKYRPLIDYLKAELGVNLELVIPKDFDEHMKMVKEGTVDFSYQNPYVFVQVWPHVQPLVITEKGKKWGIESQGVIISKINKDISKPDDLIGKRVSIVSFYSAEGFIAQKNLLQGMMINSGVDYQVFETNSNLHGNVIADVLKENTDAGFLSEEILAEPDPGSNISDEELKQINIIAKTSYIPNWIFSSRKDLSPETVNDFKKALMDIPVGSKVLKVARIRRFVPIPSNYLEEYRSRTNRKDH